MYFAEKIKYKNFQFTIYNFFKHTSFKEKNIQILNLQYIINVNILCLRRKVQIFLINDA